MVISVWCIRRGVILKFETHCRFFVDLEWNSPGESPGIHKDMVQCLIRSYYVYGRDSGMYYNFIMIKANCTFNLVLRELSVDFIFKITILYKK